MFWLSNFPLNPFLGRRAYDNNNGIIIPIYWYWVKITPVIYPIYAGLERICPRDTKNVSYVDVGHV